MPRFEPKATYKTSELCDPNPHPLATSFLVSFVMYTLKEISLVQHFQAILRVGAFDSKASINLGSLGWF